MNDNVLVSCVYLIYLKATVKGEGRGRGRKAGGRGEGRNAAGKGAPRLKQRDRKEVNKGLLGVPECHILRHQSVN